eukprot:11002142-Heterocapsa_arctica.AAC.1
MAKVRLPDSSSGCSPSQVLEPILGSVVVLSVVPLLLWCFLGWPTLSGLPVFGLPLPFADEAGRGVWLPFCLGPVEPVLAEVGEVQSAEFEDRSHQVAESVLVVSLDLWWADEAVTFLVGCRPTRRVVELLPELVVLPPVFLLLDPTHGLVGGSPSRLLGASRALLLERAAGSRSRGPSLMRKGLVAVPLAGGVLLGFTAGALCPLVAASLFQPPWGRGGRPISDAPCASTSRLTALLAACLRSTVPSSRTLRPGATGPAWGLPGAPPGP